MELKALERKSEKFSIDIKGESHTFLNILREKCWKLGTRQANYIIEHPYLSNPKIIVRAKNPKKILSNASQLIIDEAKEFENAFKRVSKS